MVLPPPAPTSQTTGPQPNLPHTPSLILRMASQQLQLASNASFRKRGWLTQQLQLAAQAPNASFRNLRRSATEAQLGLEFQVGFEGAC